MFDKEKEPYLKRAEKAYLAIGELNWCAFLKETIKQFTEQLEEIEKALLEKVGQKTLSQL